MRTSWGSRLGLTEREPSRLKAAMLPWLALLAVAILLTALTLATPLGASLGDEQDGIVLILLVTSGTALVSVALRVMWLKRGRR